jgi:hypothetical protein
VLGGMLAATVLASVYVPMFFVLSRRIVPPQGPRAGALGGDALASHTR